MVCNRALSCLLVAVVISSSAVAENLRKKWSSMSIGGTESAVQPLTVGGIESVVKPLTTGLNSVTETNSMTMFNNQGHSAYSAAYKRQQEETAKRYHRVTQERNKAAAYLKKLRKFQDEEELAAKMLKKKKSGGALKAIGGLLNFALNVANPEMVAVDMHLNKQRKRDEAARLALPSPSKYSSDSYVVQFRVPSSIKSGEVYPVRGPLQLDSHKNNYRLWYEVTGGTPLGKPGYVGEVTWTMPRRFFRINRMSGKRAYVRRDCGQHFCVHKEAQIRN
jgi:hypothetical protein